MVYANETSLLNHSKMIKYLRVRGGAAVIHRVLYREYFWHKLPQDQGIPWAVGIYYIIDVREFSVFVVRTICGSRHFLQIIACYDAESFVEAIVVVVSCGIVQNMRRFGYRQKVVRR